MRTKYYSVRKTLLNIIDILISPLRKLRIKLKANKMIHVNYDKQDNYSHHKKIILFDRDAFQSLGDEALLKVNKKYNILCPQVFVTECLAPNKASEKEKNWLLKRLNLIENPIVLIGDTHISPVIEIPHGKEYSSILTAEEIARNSIRSAPITMESVTPEKLISHYKPRINAFKQTMNAFTDTCDRQRGSLTMNRLRSETRRHFHEITGRIPTDQEIEEALRENDRTHISQNPEFAASEALLEIEYKSKEQNVELINAFLYLTDKDTKILSDKIQNDRKLTVENYPDLSYPIYIYYLSIYTICARQHNTQHLDQSYIRDFRYFHYLNFCDRFITNETSTPHIVNSFPYDDIKNTPISTATELKMELS